MTDQKYKDLMNGGWSYPKKESTDPEEVKKVVDKYLTDNKIDSETIDKKITDGVSKIVADAPEDFDTLKEMSDWISEHEDSAAAMNSAILDNKSSIDILKTDKANATDVESNTNKIKTLDENKVGIIPSTASTNVNFNNIRGLKDDDGVTTLQFFKDKNWVAQITDSTKAVNNNTNAISEIEANLDNLSYGEVAGVHNIFKIDTTNWTLTDNGIKNNAKNDGYFLGKAKLFAGKTYKISFLLKSNPTVDSTFTAYIDGSQYSNCSFVRLNSYALNVKVERDYTATSDCELSYRLWGNSNSDIFEFQLQVEEGTVATDYKPYIPSVKMLADDISHINDSLSVLGKCKNLLKTTLGSGNGNGITYINNGNGTYTLSGTCTNTFELHFNPALKLPYGKYKLLGTSAYQKTNNGEWRATVSSGEVFEVSESKPVLDVMAYIRSGSVVNETIKPMVTTNLNATVDDFVPYTGDGDTLTADVAKMKNDVDNNTNAIESINNTIIASLASSTISNAGYVYNKVAVNLPQGNYLMHLKSNGTWGTLIVGLLDKNKNRIAEYSLGHTSLNNGRTIDIYASRNISAIVMYTNSACTISEVMFSKNYNAVVDDASNINSSMSDYGLNNVFDGELEQGGIDSGTKVVKDNYVVTKNKVFCSPNDFIKTFGDNLDSSYACFYKSDGTYIGGLNALDGCTAPSESAYCYVEFKRSAITPSTAGHIGVYINNQIDVVNNGKEDKYTLELNYSTKCVNFENVVNTDEYFEAMVFDRSDKKKYIKVSGYRPSENDEENEISYINLGSKTLNIVGSNNQVIMFSGGSEVYDAYIKAIR